MVRQAFGAFRAFFPAALIVVALATGLRAAPYADLVMDARTGEVLHATNADSRLHPASLTKMMTLYIAFEAVRQGEISLDTQVTVSRKAAAEPPSKLGLRAGQKIRLRYLIRAAAVKSANDAATAIGEAIEGSEAAFARRMNRTAQALGMTRTTFKNAHGLTEAGHLSTARDMAVLGRHLFYDYPEYYNIFSRRSDDAGIARINNTNRRFLDAYEGADGIKTGYTNAAGFNLVGSAQRGDRRIIASVFGGTSTPQRNARMAALLDTGFKKAPARVAVNRPAPPRYDNLPTDPGAPVVVAAGDRAPDGTAGRVMRMTGAVNRSPRPAARGGAGGSEPPAALLAAIQSDVAAAVAVAGAATPPPPAPAAAPEAVAAIDAETAAAADQVAAAAAAATLAAATELALAVTEAAPAATPEEESVPAALPAIIPAPPRRPEALLAAAATAREATAPDTEVPAEAEAALLVAEAEVETPETPAAEGIAASPEPAEAVALAALAPAPAPIRPPDPVPPVPATIAAAEEAEDEGDVLQQVALAVPVRIAPAVEPVLRPEPESAEVVSRLSTSGGRHAGVSIGRFPSRYEAEKALIATALSDMTGFGTALRRIVQRGGGFEANFMGMTAEEAERSCMRMMARGDSCTTIGG